MSKSEMKQILIISCAIFLMLGMFTAAIGPILPEFSANTQSSLTAVGGIITAVFLGALIAQVIGGPIIDRLGYKRIMLVSLFIMSVGIIGMTLTHVLWLVLLTTFLAGLGHGSIDICINVLISKVYADRKVSALNLLNFFFGLGAFIGPSIVSLTLKTMDNGMVVLWLTAAVLFLSLPFAARMKDTSLRGTDAGQPGSSMSVYRSGLLWMLGFMLLLYVGVENGVGGWVTTYLHLTTPLSVETAALVSSGFWGAFTVGRFIGAMAGTRLGSRRLLAMTLCLSTAAGLLFALSSGNQTLSIVAIVLMGLGFGPVYPTTMAVVTTHYQNSPGIAVSLGAAMGSFGGMAVPFIQGFLMENAGPSASTWLITICIVAMLGLFFVLRKPVYGAG
jgi:fucose permease